MWPMATVHMIHGFVCVGKSTFAAELAAKVKGICISPDEWVVFVFGSNTPEEGWSRELFDERYWRIRDLADRL